MKPPKNIKIYSPIVQEAYDRIPELDWATDAITEGIASRIDAVMKEKGMEPTFLLGARSAGDLLQQDKFKALGRVFVTTEDGSEGEKGFVTQHSLLQQEKFTQISVCGPKPMIVAVARYAKSLNTPCEVSLENMMACGLGACLCCVEDTEMGNVCVCKEGPVFDIKKLKWQI